MSLFKSRNFALLWIGRLISLMGDWMLDIALPIWIYQLTGSAVALGTMVAIQQAPGILLAPLAGVLVDRWDRKRVLIMTYFLMGLVIPLLFLVNAPAHIPIIYLVGLLNGILGAFILPARSAFLPSLVEKEQLMQANSLFAVAGQGMVLVGPALGGAVFAWAGPQVSFSLDMISFFIAALFVAAIRLSTASEAEETMPKPEGFKGLVADLREGLEVIRRFRALWAVLTVWAILIFAGGAVSAVLVVFVREALGGDNAAYGYLLSTQGLGMFIGGALTMTLGSRVKAVPAIVGGLFAFGLVFLIGANVSNIWVAAILVCILGALMALVGISQSTLTQEVTPDAFRGRVQSTGDTIAALMMLVGALAGGFVAEQAGVRAVFNGAAILSLVAASVALALLRPSQAGESAVIQPVEN